MAKKLSVAISWSTTTYFVLPSSLLWLLLFSNIIEYFYWKISLNLEFKLTSINKNKYDDLLFQSKCFICIHSPKFWHRFKSTISCSSFQALFIRFCTNDVYLCVPAVDWVLQQGQLVVPSSPVALVRSGLSHMADVTTRAHFSVALVNGLSANLTDASRQIFVKQVSRDNVCAVPLTFHMLCLKNSIQFVFKYYLIIQKLLYFYLFTITN